MRPLLAFALLLTTLVAAGSAPAAAGQPPTSDLGFGKAFSPATIGPGSTSALTFTIDASDVAEPVSDLDFTDVLPAGMTLADPSGATTDCTNAVLVAADGGTVITMSGGQVAPFGSCTVTVNVVGTATATNVSGNLTSSDGISGVAVATLTVDTALPGFSKSFSPGAVPVDRVSTLTFLIDNSANDAGLFRLSFLDSLPAGLVVASPANATTDCGAGVAATVALDAVPGGGTIRLTADKFTAGEALLGAGATCTIEVDVTPQANGSFPNVSSELEVAYAPFGSLTGAGFATAQLEVPIEFLVKTYIDDPVRPGGMVTLRFAVNNLDRNHAATAIAFDDPIDASLTGLAPAEALPKAACGGTVDFAAGVLGLSGASLAPGGACTFDVLLAVPGGTAPGSYTNTTDPITATVDGLPIVGNRAADDLVVTTAPSFTKEFVDDPSGAGGPTTLRFTITNNDAASSLTDIAFADNLGADLGLGNEPTIPGLAATAPLPDTSSCGGSSSLTGTTNLSFTGGSLAPAGDAGDSCSFDVVLSIPVGTPDGAYPNTSSVISAKLGGEAPVEGPAASDDLVVVGAPTIVKEFTDDPALPGGTATLEFTITHSDVAPGAATGITFTDDLEATLTGLAATGLPAAGVCGLGSQLTGTGTLTLTGGTLGIGESCTFSVTLAVPAGANAGSYPNETSNISATVDGIGVVGNPATDDLRIAGVTLTKEFIDDPVFPGRRATLRFTLDNVNPNGDDATGIFFADDLDAALDNLAALAPLPDTSSCGGSSSLAGTTFLVFSGGALKAGTSCFFDVTVLVPGATPVGDYINTTSAVSATMNGGFFVGDPATDTLIVETPLPPLLTKTFTDDPVAPGGTVTLQFEITNPNDSDPLTSIAFTDDLATVLAGLTASLPTDPDPPCGASSSVVLSNSDTLITFAGGELGPDQSCTFSLVLAVPARAGGGSYPNTTSPISGEYDACGDACFEPVDGTAASDSLVVSGLLPRFTKTFTDDPVIPGAPVTLRFTIDNSGSTADAIGLAFSDDLDAVISGLTATDVPLTDVCGAGSLVSGTSMLTLTGGTLSAGATCTFDVMLGVPADAVAGEFPNTTTDLFASGVSVAAPATDGLVIELPDISVTKDDGLTTAVPGRDGVLYTIVVTNNGSATVPVEVRDTVVLDCAWISDVDPGVTGNTASGNGDIADDLVMPGGSSATYTVNCIVDPAATGTLSNTVTATPPVTDITPSDNSATDTTDLTPVADLSVTKTDNVATAVPGADTIVYEVVVGNAGPSDAPAVSLTDSLPVVLDCTWTSVAAGGASGNTLSGAGDLDESLSLPVGSSVTYTSDCSIDPAATGTLTNTADVGFAVAGPTVRAAAPITDPDPSDNSATDTTDLTPVADLSVTKTDNVATAVPGADTIVYEIVVGNAGPSDAPAVSLTDSLPVVLDCTWTSVAAGGASGNTLSGAGDLDESLSLPVGSSVTYTSDCSIDPAATGTLTNTADVGFAVAGPTVRAAAPITDPDPSDNSATDTTDLTPVADLSVTKTDNVATAVPGADTIVYEIVVGNAGPSDAPAVSLTDSLPVVLDCTWTSVAAGGASGNTLSGAGDLDESLSLPVGSSVTYTSDCSIDPAATGTLTNTADVGFAVAGPAVRAAAPITDPDPSDNSATDTTDLTPVADLSVTKTDEVTVAVPGEDPAVTYTVVVANAGPSTDPAVGLADVFPTGATCAWTSVAAGGAAGHTAAGSGDLSETLSMPPGSSVTYTIGCALDPSLTGLLSNTATATASRGVTDPVPGNNAATDDDELTPVADIAVSKTDGRTTAVPGEDPIAYTIVVENLGPSDAPMVLVDDVFPPELVDCTWLSVAEGGASGNTAAGSGAVSDLLSMPAGSKVTYVTDCSIDPAATGTLTNTVTAGFPAVDAVGFAPTTQPTDLDDKNNTATDTTELTPEADLSVTKVDTEDPVVAGETVTYTVEVTNAGPSDATGVTVVDTVPGDLMFDTATVPCVAGPPGTLTCDLGTVAAGTSSSFDVTFVIDPGALGDVVNVVEVSSAVPERDAGDNVTDETTTIVAEADLSIVKTDTVDPVVAGTTVTYTIGVVNAGPSDATSVSVVDTVPAGLMFDSADVVCLAGVPGPGLLTCDLGTIPDGVAASFDVTFTIDPSALGEIVNVADVSSDATDTNVEDNTILETTKIVAEADLSITKIDDVDPVFAGTDVTYTIEVSNAGPSDATGVVVTDALPAGMTLVSTSGCAEDPNGVPTCTLGDIPASGTAAYTVTATVGIATPFGALTNTATVSSDATDPDGTDNSVSETTTVSRAAIDVEKATNGVDADTGAEGPLVDVGTPVTWTYVVTNTGLDELYDIVVTDDQIGAIDCPATRLLPATSMTCSATGNATPGSYANVASVTARSEAGERPGDMDASHYTGVFPDAGIDIQKTPDLQTILGGATAEFTITVQNTSAATQATNVVVSDPLAPDCDADLGTLEPQEIVEYTCSLSGVTDTFTNVASVEAVVGTEALTDEDGATVTVLGTVIEVSKTPSTQTIPSGGTASWTITVRNNVVSTLTDVTVSDPLAPDCDRAIGELTAFAFFTYTCSLSGATADFTNEVTAEATFGETTVSDTASADVVVNPPGLEITKTPPLQTIDVGGTASWTITVSNTGTVDLTAVEVSDPSAPDCDRVIGDLAAGDDVTYSCSLAGVAANFTNVATARGLDPELLDLEASAEAAVIVRQPQLDIQKTPDLQVIAPGDTATFTIEVTNTSRDELSGVAVTDPLSPDCDRTIGFLAGGASVTYECTIDDVTEGFVNVADVRANDGTATPVADSDDATVQVSGPSIALTKTPDTQTVKVGGTATFTITVENTGDLAFTDVVVSDDLAPDCARDLGTVGVEVTVTYSCALAGVIDGFTNTATVTALGGSVTATATADVVVDPAPTVTIDQAADQPGLTNTAPIEFTAVFSEPVSGFGPDDIVLTSTGGTGGTATISGAQPGTTFTVSVTGMSDGILSATIVAGAAQDSIGNDSAASTSTDNDVEYDSTPPVINTPGTIRQPNDPGEAGAVVEYDASADDQGVNTPVSGALLFGGALTSGSVFGEVVAPGGVVCTPTSGSFFPIGTTEVTCSATDLAGNSSTAKFRVVISDVESPVVIGAGTVNVSISAGPSAPVDYPLPTASDNSGPVPVICVPPPGSIFSVGTTRVTCTATDSSGNTTVFGFDLVVTAPLIPATGGGLTGLTMGLQLLMAGLLLVGVSRLRRRRRMPAT